MKKTRMAFLLSALFPLACGPVLETDAEREQEPAQAKQSLLTLDSSALAARPAGLLPAQRLAPGAFELANIRQGLIQTSETFQSRGVRGTRVEHDGADWRFEVDPAHGEVLALRKTPPPERAAGAQDEVALQKQATSRLKAWGIPDTELGQASQQRVMGQDLQQNEKPSAARVQSYKTFFFRTLDGVRVEGHRAVVSHGPDGRFYRALVKWPPLASSGHRLRATLSLPDIEKRAQALLAREGITAGKARMSWQYSPAELASGEVVLTLQAVIRVSSAALGEPRLYLVDVDSEP